MKKISNCCNANIREQNTSFFCTHCIRILNDTDIRYHIPKVAMFIASIVFLYSIFNTSALYAPIANYFIDSDTTNHTYAIDHMQIRVIEGNNSAAVSVKGAVGNMQIMPVTLDDWNQCHPNNQYEPVDLLNSRVNIRIGTWMLEDRIPEILNDSKVPLTINHILIAYNWGCGNLIKWYNNGAIINKLPDETQQYICKYWAKATI